MNEVIDRMKYHFLEMVGHRLTYRQLAAIWGDQGKRSQACHRYMLGWRSWCGNVQIGEAIGRALLAFGEMLWETEG